MATARNPDDGALMKLVIDDYLATLAHRQIVPAHEVVDLLLDVRNTFFAPLPDVEPAATPVCSGVVVAERP